jgi:hypothetical protein
MGFARSFREVQDAPASESKLRALRLTSFDRYDQKSLLAAFRDMPNFIMCLGPRCDSGQIHETGDDQPIMTCTTCHFKTCFTHKMPWHSGQTCAEYDAYRQERMDQEAASEKLIASTTKKCPNPRCGHGIEKSGGCDHMTCKLLIEPSKCNTMLIRLNQVSNAGTNFATSAWLPGR